MEHFKDIISVTSEKLILQKILSNLSLVHCQLGVQAGHSGVLLLKTKLSTHVKCRCPRQGMVAVGTPIPSHANWNSLTLS